MRTLNTGTDVKRLASNPKRRWIDGVQGDAKTMLRIIKWLMEVLGRRGWGGYLKSDWD